MPYDGIGGVERAAATADGASYQDLVLERMFIFQDIHDRSQRISTFNPFALLAAANRLTKSEPSLVIVSLWRAIVVSGLAWLRGCRAPMVLFIHNSRDAHILDRILTRAAAKRASAIWADSNATSTERLPSSRQIPTRVISFLLEKVEPARRALPNPKPNIIFWGRIAEQKNPLRMLELFAQLHAKRPEATLTVIGPDGGMETALRKEIERKGLEEAITLTGPLSHKEINTLAAKASFYLQTSHHEGMALSVVEAMQRGLVPVVTPVGEVAHYTADGRNAIWVGNGPGSDSSAIASIEDTLNSPNTWRKLRKAAIGTFIDKPIYSKDILVAAAELLASLSVQSSTK